MKYFVAVALAACILIPGSAAAAYTAPDDVTTELDDSGGSASEL